MGDFLGGMPNPVTTQGTGDRRLWTETVETDGDGNAEVDAPGNEVAAAWANSAAGSGADVTDIDGSTITVEAGNDEDVDVFAVIVR